MASGQKKCISFVLEVVSKMINTQNLSYVSHTKTEAKLADTMVILFMKTTMMVN